MRGGWSAAGHLVPAAPGQPRPAAASASATPGPGAAPRPGRGRAAGHPRCAALGTVHRHRPGRGLGHAAGRGHLPRLGVHVYRVLRQAGESRERRAQAAHPATVKPELAATGPNQVYSWDITKLHGPAKWTYYHLYVILDIYSRYAVGWMVATRESAALAEKLIAATAAKQGISPGSSLSTPTAAPR